MSIFYEEDVIGGDYDQDKKDFTNPNDEGNYSDEDLYNEFNKIGDSYIKIKEHTSIFHDDIIEEKCVSKAPAPDNGGSIKDKIKSKLPGGKKEDKDKPEKKGKDSVEEAFSIFY